MRFIDRIELAPAPIGCCHCIDLPTDPEQRLREIAKAEKPHRGPRTDPLLRSLVRAGIRRLVDTVRKTMNRPTEADLHDLHERRRERNRAKVREAILALRPRIGPEARRRLADHHVAIIICADEKEVQQWNKHLGGHDTAKKSTAFVKWRPVELAGTKGGNPVRINVPLVVWNGGSSIDEQSVYYHELAHLIDGHQTTRRISDDIEWQRLLEREKGALRLMLIGEKTRDHIVSSSSESFAEALAESWRNPANAAHRIPGMYRFLIQRGLVAEPALPSSANAPP